MATEQAIQTYPWWDQVPEHLKTATQLGKEGMKPGGPPAARIEYGRGRRHRIYDLYDVGEAVVKRPATPAQLAALEQARTAAAARREAALVAELEAEEAEDEEHRSVIAETWQIDGDEAILEMRGLLARDDLVILDTETTGLHFGAYIVQIGILARDGTVLLDTLVKPAVPIENSYIHHITDDMVQDAPTIGELVPRLERLLHGRPVAVYNASFDREILNGEVQRVLAAQMLPLDEATLWEAARAAGHAWIGAIEWHDVMGPYAAWYGDWSDYHGGWRWQALSGGDHTAIGDCRACLRVMQEMAATKLSTEKDEE